MMNGDISRIPIQSFGAVFSLTDIIQELPLPSAFPHEPGEESLLADPATSNDAMRHLCSKDENLICSITEVLSKVSTDNMYVVFLVVNWFLNSDLGDKISEPLENSNLPPILTSILQRDASVFHSKSNCCIPSKSSGLLSNPDGQSSFNEPTVRHSGEWTHFFFFLSLPFCYS